MVEEKLEAVKYPGVIISRKGVAKMYGARVERFFPRDEIRELRVMHGYPGERRWIQLGLGTLLLGAAALQILDLVIWLLGGGLRYTSNILVLFILIGLGGWLVRDASHKQWYLEVQTPEKTRKLPFGEEISDENLNNLLLFSRELGFTINAAEFQTKNI